MKLITYEEAAEQYRCHRATVERAVKKGKIEAYKPGKLVLLNAESVNEWFLSTQIKPVRTGGRPRQQVQVSPARR